jgi:hypothetical protein
MIASVFLWLSVRYSTNKRKTNRVKRTHLLALFHNLVKPIIAIDEPPVIHLPVFQDALNDV